MRLWIKGNLGTLGTAVNWYSHCGQQQGVSSKIKNKTTIFYSNSTTGHIYKGNEITLEEM